MNKCNCRPLVLLICVAVISPVVVSPAMAEPPRGYSIPLIDLANQSERQVVVDREAGVYLGHPTTVLLEDNKTMIVVYPKGHGRGAIVMKRSPDGGRTWSERLPVPDSWATSKETPTIHRVVDAQGKRRLIVWSGLYPARLAVSENDGQSWSELKPAGPWGGIVVMGSVVSLDSPGRYLAMFHDDGRFFEAEGRRGPFTLFKTFSADGGLTWTFPEAILKSSEIHLCEPGVIRSPDGKQLAALLRENSRRRNSFVVFSNDEGKTWSQPHELPGALTGDRHTGKYAPDGRLFVSFRDVTHESPTHGDWVAWVGRYDDIVEGREGQYRVRLMDNHSGQDCAYPGVVVLPDGTIVTTTYGHWTQGQSPYVVSVRLKLEELDAIASAEQSKEIDERPLKLKIERAFKKLRPRRPVVLTHAGDGTNRLFVGTQQGVIHVMPNRQDVREMKTFLDIESSVVYSDEQNEEGLLGVAFHPDYRENGVFFVYYTTTDAPLTSVVSRFRVSSDDPNRADRQSEEELMRIKQPYWNHNGGTLAFGPDGYLYIGLGDGGKFNDPHMNGQNIQTLLGSILRIDVDRKDKGLKYAIPRDNPFYGQPRLARGEVFAFGFRNVWRLAFDRETEQLWAADVGQDIWEEINLVRAGGNYGWNLREANHKFGPVGSDQRPDLIDPVWEYDHEVGKSITGGVVYRGKRHPELTGAYLYADYVSGKIWALKYDFDNQRVVSNRALSTAGIEGGSIPVITFGEDEQGEVYLTDAFGRIFGLAQ